MQIQFGLDGEVVSEDYSGSVADPSREVKYTDDQKRAAAATVPLNIARSTTQQQQIDKQTAHIKYLEAKAIAVDGYDSDGQPRYIESADARAKHAKIAAMERTNLALSAQLAELSLGEDTLDSYNATTVSLENQVAHHAALEERARAIVFEKQAQALAETFAPKIANGNGEKLQRF